MRLSPPGTYFTAESTEAMRIKSLAQGENILMLRFEPATFVSKNDILTTTPIVHVIFCSQGFLSITVNGIDSVIAKSSAKLKTILKKKFFEKIPHLDYMQVCLFFHIDLPASTN